MSNGIISIGGQNYYRIVAQEFAAGDKDIVFKLTGNSNSDFNVRVGSNNNNSNFHVENDDGDPIFRCTGSGLPSFKLVSKIVDSGAPAGEKGDLVLQARPDSVGQNSNIILHHDSDAPYVHIEALNQRVTTASLIGDSNNVVYSVGAIIGGLIERHPNGGIRTDTFPSATDLITAINDAKIGDTLEFMITNTDSLTAKGAGVQRYIDLNVGSTAWTASSGQTNILPGETKIYKFVIINVDSPAYIVNLLGSSNRLSGNWFEIFYENISSPIEIATSTTSDQNIITLLNNAGANPITTPTTPQLFDVGTTGVKNRGPPCVVKVVGRITLANKFDDDPITIETAIAIDNGVKTSSITSALFEFANYASPQIQTTYIGTFEHDEEAFLTIIQKGGSSSDVKVYSVQLIVTQVDNYTI